MVDFRSIGQRLKAHRLGAAMSPEEAAERLGVSRAALYNYERGSTPIKVETLERMADVLDVSLPSLLGAGTEYFSTAIAYFERLRQIESESERITLFYEPITFLLTSSEFSATLKTMLLECLPEPARRSGNSEREVDEILGILERRRGALGPRGPSVVGLIGLTEVKRLLRTGLIGTYTLSDAVRRERRDLARTEIQRTIELIESEPLGTQIGVIDDTVPNQTFELCRLRDGSALVAVSPFRLGEFPNVRLGVASITAAADAVALYERLVATMWQRATKGLGGAALLRKALDEVTR
jgi:transcriptional regulator with XRE-family HTH domain